MHWLPKIILILLIFNNCSFKPTQKNEIIIVGSDTMLELTSNLAEHYMKENPGFSVKVEGGGTAAGIRQLIKGEIDIYIV